MANLKTKRLWDEAWSKLSNFFFTPSAFVESPFGAGPVEITEPLTLYVATTGNDGDDGSQARPYRQVQAAIDWLAGKVVKGKVTIQVGVGAFEAFAVDGSTFDISGVSTVDAPLADTGLTIIGTWVAPTLTTGTTSGTATGLVTDQALVLTDLTQTWTVDELKGKYVLISGVYFPIASNTATTMTVVNGSTLSGAYSVWDLGTVIDTGTCYVSSGTGTTRARIVVSNVEIAISSYLTISTLKVLANDMVSGNVGITTRTSSCTFENITVERTVGPDTAATSIQGDGFVQVSRCYFYQPTGLTMTFAVPPSRVTMSNVYFRSGATQLSSPTFSGLSVVFCTFENASTAGISISGVCHALVNTNRFVNCPTAISIGTSTSGSHSMLTSTTTNFFSGCGTVLAIAGSSQGLLGPCTGTGNTNGIVATKGAKVQINSTGTLGAVTELSVDGTTGTLAAMRGNSPKVFPLTPNAYGTYIYE